MNAVLFHGGRVQVKGGTSAEALLARDGRVAAVGRAEDLAREAGGAERIDLRGGLMVPGWGDVHCHFVWWAQQMSRIDISDAATIDEALSRIDAYASGLAEGRWILGGRFDKNAWGRWPTAKELDRVSHGRPAALRSRDGHARWTNTRALEIAEIRADTRVPPGGVVERDEGGAPTGILKENAIGLVDRVLPQPGAQERYELARLGQAEAWRRGLTLIGCLDDFVGTIPLGAFDRMRARGELGLRIHQGLPLARLDEAIALGLRTGYGDDLLRIGPLKIFTDGALGSQTAALEEPYGGTRDRGVLTIEPDRLAERVATAAAADISVAIHAIGDRAVHVALDAIEPTRRTAPQLRQRVEHIQLVRSDDLSRFGALGIVASMQPIHATSDRDLADRYWGAARTARAYPWRSLSDGGAVLAFGSDAPVEPIDPLLGIHAAVTRMRPGDAGPWHPEQALTLDEALGAYSAGVAYALGREAELGTLEVGKRCDATVVSADLARVPPPDWPGLHVSATVVDGVVRFAEGIA
ncbi:MAG: amidohydrolase [Chloroflexota bacterium]|nr:amidohydrolase [Chloroflexota bacterium]